MTRSAWRLPGYRIDELLGAGSSGEVWRARVSATGVAVAVKRIWLSDPAQRTAALSEAAMLSSLDHPHLMKLHELRHVDDEAIVLVLDLAGGGSLASLLARRGRLTAGEAITAIAPIAAALAYAHHNGVVHGDVSPANILFTDIGLPLLADLGVARLLGDSAKVRTTPAYADPAVAGGALPGAPSDVFMLGAVALHVLTGAPAWPGTDPADVIEAARAGEPPDFAGRLSRAGVPGSIVEVIARALSIDAPHRGTAADFALDLRHAGEPVAVELAAGGRRLPPVVPDRRAESWPLESVPMASGSVAESSPVPAVAFVGEQPLTYGVRAPAPFAAAGAARHLARSRPRVATGLIACAAALTALIAGGLWWWPFSASHQGAPASLAGASSVAQLARPARPSISPATSTAPRSAKPAATASSAPAGTVLRGEQLRAVLAELDARRSHAYARRDPALLTAVYASPGLLARDQALLTSIVPPGCGLRGVHTAFSQLAVMRRTGTLIVFRADSALAPSTLVCRGTASGHATGTAPAPMRIELIRGPGGYRIAAQSQL